MTSTQPEAQTEIKSDTGSEAPAHLSRLILTGFMGAGKSTIGRLLAARINWSFLDLDAHLEARTGATIPQLFERHGEAHFRRLESAALASALGQNHTVLADPAAAQLRFQKRHPLYRRLANLTIDTADQTPEQTVEIILKSSL